MKNILLIVFFSISTLFYAISMKPPIDFLESVEVTEKSDSVLYQIKINDGFINYSLAYIEFSNTVYEQKKISELNIKVYEKLGMFCFEMNKKDLPKETYWDPWIYLYNKSTKRYECYKV